jgi:hypothetical protein
MAKDGSLPLCVGVALVLLGGVLLLLTLRNPSFDPARLLRAPIDEGTAAVDIPAAGDYVVSTEGPDCSTTGGVELVQEGQEAVQKSSSPTFRSYEYGGLCGTSLGVYPVPASGIWTAVTPPTLGGNLTAYPENDPPTRVDSGPLWVALPLIAAGLVVSIVGFMQRRRWRRANPTAA